MEKWKKFKQEQINETTLNRIKKNVEELQRNFIIISADRHEKIKRQNLRNYQMLQKSALSESFSFDKVKGGWQEKDDDGNMVEVNENSLIIYDDDEDPTDLFEFAREQAAKFNQEAFIFGRRIPVTNEYLIAAYDYQGNRIDEDWAGPWNTIKAVNSDAAFWSKVRGSKFQLKEQNEQKIFTNTPTSWIDAFRKIRSGKRWY